MRLPGTRYQEHGWEHVRKLLGQCSLQAFAQLDPARLLDPAAQAGMLDEYIDAVAALLHAAARSPRWSAAGNSYGDGVAGLALSLLYELQAHPGDWAAFGTAVAAEYRKQGAFRAAPGGEASLRKKVNDMYAGLRDKVDAGNYQAACGRSCSANKIYAYRMLDMACADIARLFEGWQSNADQVAAILDRPVAAAPIEARRMQSIGACRPEWVMRWSASREQFTGSPGPLHTRSKRFASLKNSVQKIGAMLAEIGEYEGLSANRDGDWQLDSAEAALWLEDLGRVLAESGQAASSEADQILAPEADEFEAGDDAIEPEPEPQTPAAAWEIEAAAAASVSLPPRFMELARAAQDRNSWSARVLGEDSLPVRLAVCLKILGPADDSYPDEWRDPATGELPTMQQLAALDQVSLPTLRKRREAAIARLTAAPPP